MERSNYSSENESAVETASQTYNPSDEEFANELEELFENNGIGAIQNMVDTDLLDNETNLGENDNQMREMREETNTLYKDLMEEQISIQDFENQIKMLNTKKALVKFKSIQTLLGSKELIDLRKKIMSIIEEESIPSNFNVLGKDKKIIETKKYNANLMNKIDEIIGNYKNIKINNHIQQKKNLTKQ